MSQGAVWVSCVCIFQAYELSTLTGTQVMLLVASETGHVYTFATRKLQPMITSDAGKALIQERAHRKMSFFGFTNSFSSESQHASDLFTFTSERKKMTFVADSPLRRA